MDYYQTVGADYFETMGIPIVDGRGFAATDDGGAPVAIVNETFVRTFFPDRSPIGQRLRVGFSDRNPWLTIVGVAKDVKQGGVDQKTGTELYFHLPQAIANAQLFAPSQMHLVVRSDLPPGSLASAVGDVVRQRRRGAALRPAAAGWTRCSANRSAGRGCWRSCSASSPGWRCCSPPSAPTACSPTWSPSGAARSASAWRWGRTRARWSAT